MAGVKKVDKPLPPKFLATNQFKLAWKHFTLSENQPVTNGVLVHAKVAMNCEFDFAEAGDVLVYLDAQKRWRLGKITVKCVMNKSLSVAWEPKLRKNTAAENAELLKHERVHVELAERHARYVFKQIQLLATVGSDLEAVTQTLINAAHRIRVDHWSKLDIKNIQYDDLTTHGTNTKVQQHWNNIYLSVENSDGVL